jgi:response regulator RpfG family c-di-GMP phosphodiesterase
MKKKITVIEDRYDHSALINHISADTEIEISIADNIVDFYRIHEQGADAIILDDHLHEGFNNRLYNILKENRHTRNIPVILISDTESIKDDPERCLNDDFILKPFNPGMLKKKIDSLFNAA